MMCVQAMQRALEQRLASNPARPRLAVRCSAGPRSSDARHPSRHLSRRDLMHAAAAAPLLQLLLAGGPAVPPALAAEPAAALRYLTPEQAAAVDAAFAATLPKSKAPVMVRLVFHDAGSYDAAAGDGGVNASIQYELDRPDNFGLKRGWNVIEATQKKLRGTAAEGVVSQADLIALAGAYAVRITGGPQIQVAVGRRDATSADPDGRMPALDSTAEQQIANFAAKGLSAQELVVLSGSHTLGSKGYGDPVTFDNTYFKTLLAAPWTDKTNEMAQHTGIPTDHVLPDSPVLRPIIQRYADDQPSFFQDFAAAYVKMTNLGARWA